MIATLENVRRIKAQQIPDVGADLFIYEQERTVPFPVRRVFAVYAREITERGRHAHRNCSQVMVCLAGACDVLVDDGAHRKTIALDRPSAALYVPPSIWAEQRYRQEGTILMVLCDREYDESDYIRDYDAFLAFRKGAA